MKILYVTNELSPFHGYGRVALDLIKSIQPNRVNLEVVTQKNAVNHTQSLNIKTKIHAKLTHKPTSPFSRPWQLFHDYWLIEQLSQHFDLIHFLTESHLAYASFLTKPYLVTAHGTWALRPLTSHWMSNRVFTRAYNQAQRVVCVSEYTQSKLRSHLPQAKLTVIHNGIELAAPKHKKKQVVPIKHILSVGALNPGKDYPTAVSAVAQVGKSYPQLTYTIVSGRDNPELAKQLYHVAKQLDFRGLKILNQVPDKELAELYQDSDIFLLTPREQDHDIEGFGLIFVEAALHGLPVVSTRSGAVTEVLDKLENGLLAPERDVSGIADHLHHLLSSPRQRQQLVAQGREQLPYFSSERMVAEYLEMYQAVLNQL